MTHVILLLVALVLGTAELGRAEEKTVIQWGKELFAANCASCHGADATGSGPAAKSLKSRPTDLTKLSKTHAGEFPRWEVVSFIDGQRPLEAHQSEMPRWGAIFRRRPNGSISAAGSVPEIYAIADYLASIQKK
jgi:mono/diheme cytochrome c family protein